MLELSTPAKAQLLLLASMRVRARRVLGDVEGHDFHGNQWTAGAGLQVAKGESRGPMPPRNRLASYTDHEGYTSLIYGGVRTDEKIGNMRKGTFHIVSPSGEKIRNGYWMGQGHDLPIGKAAFSKLSWEQKAGHEATQQATAYKPLREQFEERKRDIGTRHLGDVEGHDFHGNQYTSGAGGGQYPTGLTKIGSAKGSNPGGLHVDASGQKWYVKEYGKPEQAASEHVANQIYEAVGAKVPETALGPHGELASKWLPDAGKTLGQTGLTKDNANAILDHYAADVFTANWDAVGTGHDNILVGKDGVTRVDQGGTLLYRAQGGLKPEGGLGKIGEWHTLADPGMNKYYSQVFKAAGVKNPDALGSRAVKQIDRIVASRPAGGWKSFVEKAAPNAGAGFHAKVGAMLESRQKGLEEKRDALKLKGLAEWNEEDHPRGPDGKFGTGDGTKAQKAPKAAPVPMHLKHQAYAMVKGGKSFKATAKELGMTQGQVAGHVWKTDQKQKAVDAALKAHPAPAASHSVKQDADGTFSTVAPDGTVLDTGYEHAYQAQEDVAFYEKNPGAAEKAYAAAKDADVAKYETEAPAWKDLPTIKEYEASVATTTTQPMTVQEKKQAAYDLVKSGTTYKDAAAIHGLTPGQVSGHVWKTDQKAKAEAAKSSPSIHPAVGYTVYGKGVVSSHTPGGGAIYTTKTTGAKNEYDAKGNFVKQISEGTKPAKAAPAEFMPSPDTHSVTTNSAGEKIITEHATGNLIVTKGAAGQGQTKAEYKWTEKTKENSPHAKENLGKYAYFKDGVQVSGAFPKGEHAEAAGSINQGQGPSVGAATSISAAYVPAKEDFAAHVEKGTAPPESAWPIKNDVNRTEGMNTPKQMNEIGSKWAAGLTAKEVSSIKGYTGSSYHGVNAALRQGAPVTASPSANAIHKAIEKSPNPPPPELVWRGVSHSGAAALVKGLSNGDVVKLPGFQSTSINPHFAKNWASGGTVFEIKPSAGAYVKVISSHAHEHEYLLPHNASYAVRGIAHTTIDGKKQAVVKLEMLHHGH